MPPLDKRWISQAYTAAQQLHNAGKLDMALKGYRAILARAPQIAEAHFQIGRILVKKGQIADARVATEAALKLRPTEEAIWTLLAEIAQSDDKGKVQAVLNRARKAGLSKDTVNRIQSRIKHNQTRPADEPTVPEAVKPFLKRAAEAVQNGQETAALKLIDRALSKAPNAAPVLIRRAEVLMTLGDLAEAQKAADAAVSTAPEVANYWRVWARAAKRTKSDPNIPILEKQFKQAAADSNERRQMGFALAKVMEDIGAYDRVFSYLNEANAITHRQLSYNHAADLEIAERVRRAYSPGLTKTWEGKGWTDAAPIFVTGLPRSGTTLVEQILSSHSSVSGAGETSRIYRPLSDIINRVDMGEVEAGAEFFDLGKKYAQELARRFPGVPRVTDKSIATYVLLGYVRLALPNAKVIVVRRDPRDSCVSLLKTQFENDQHRYSYSMETTAAFYKLFANQVAYWRKAAPDAFIEVQYEDVIKDLEGQARRLLDYCELEWEDGVLDFHKNKRNVKTLSTAQVRQPLYSSSVGAWRRYEADLKPLFAALGPIEDLP